jgi:Chaperone of endosialidase
VICLMKDHVTKFPLVHSCRMSGKHRNGSAGCVVWPFSFAWGYSYHFVIARRRTKGAESPHMKRTPLPRRHSMNRLPCRFALLTPLALACFAFLPGALAICNEGCDSSLFNAFLGDDALSSNTVGAGNTAIGWRSLFSNTDSSFNTAVGGGALSLNTGDSNAAVGAAALLLNTVGSQNVAIGTDALVFNDSGADNAAIGWFALFENTTGGVNTAIGAEALSNNTSGFNNIALGFAAGDLLTTGDDNIDIGNEGVADEGGTVRIGTDGTQTRTFIAGINGVVVSGAGVVVNASGQLGVAASSARFKDEIKPMDKASETILALKPVTFRYKHDLDPAGIPQFGLVAEQVEKVNPDLVARDNEGKPYTVRYEAVNAMLLNEFLKEHKAFLEEQQSVGELKKQVAALTAGLQKVSAQLELNKPAPQTVLNKQ